MPTLQRYFNEQRQWSLVQGSSILPPINGARLLLPSADYPGNNFYVATNGADTPISAGGGTVAAPFLTPAFASAQLSSALDFGGQTVTLQAVAGHANFTAALPLNPWVGGGTLVCDGGGGSIAPTSGAAILDNHVGNAVVQNVALSSGDSQAIDCVAEGNLFLANGLSFGTCGLAHMRLRNPGGTLFCNANGAAAARANISYTVTGGAFAHLQVTAGQAVFEGTQVTHTGTTTYSQFLLMFSGLLFPGNANFNVTNQTIRGTRFNIKCPAAVFETGGNVNLFPGDVAGVVWSSTAYQ